MFNVGDKVRLREDVDLYPINVIPAGTTGTIKTIYPDGDLYMYVHLDTYVEGLEEWNNELQIMRDNFDGTGVEVLERI